MVRIQPSLLFSLKGDENMVHCGTCGKEIGYEEAVSHLEMGHYLLIVEQSDIDGIDMQAARNRGIGG